MRRYSNLLAILSIENGITCTTGLRECKSGIGVQLLLGRVIHCKSSAIGADELLFSRPDAYPSWVSNVLLPSF